MSLRIGFFPAFKGQDTVLLSGTPKDIDDLRQQIERFDRSTGDTLDVSSAASNSPKHPAELWLAKSMVAAQRLSGFVLICSKDKCLEIVDLLAPLTSATKGHQYFDLNGGSVHLMISVGEYSEQWWESNA